MRDNEKKLLDTLRPTSLEYSVVIRKICFNYGRMVEKPYSRILSIPTHIPALAQEETEIERDKDQNGNRVK